MPVGVGVTQRLLKCILLFLVLLVNLPGKSCQLLGATKHLALIAWICTMYKEGYIVDALRLR